MRSTKRETVWPEGAVVGGPKEVDSSANGISNVEPRGSEAASPAGTGEARADVGEATATGSAEADDVENDGSVATMAGRAIRLGSEGSSRGSDGFGKLISGVRRSRARATSETPSTMRPAVTNTTSMKGSRRTAGALRH